MMISLLNEPSDRDACFDRFRREDLLIFFLNFLVSSFLMERCVWSSWFIDQADDDSSPSEKRERERQAHAFVSIIFDLRGST